MSVRKVSLVLALVATGCVRPGEVTIPKEPMPESAPQRTSPVSAEAPAGAPLPTPFQPQAPTLLVPYQNEYTSSTDLIISGLCSGLCAEGARVELEGASAQTARCENQTFLFVASLLDGDHDLSLTQIVGGLRSPDTPIHWSRRSYAGPSPLAWDHYGQTAEGSPGRLVLAGPCETGAVVELYGDVTNAEVVSPEGELLESCSGGRFSFTVERDRPGTYTIYALQAIANVPSAPAKITWVVYGL